MANRPWSPAATRLLLSYCDNKTLSWEKIARKLAEIRPGTSHYAAETHYRRAKRKKMNIDPNWPPRPVLATKLDDDWHYNPPTEQQLKGRR